MKAIFILFGLFAAVFLHAGIALGVDAIAPSLLPQPVEMKIGEGVFTLDARTVIIAPPEATGEAQYLAAALAPAMGYRLTVNPPVSDVPNSAIVFQLVPARSDLSQEGYALHITPTGVLIEALKPAGIFYGIQTLRQLLPPQIYNGTPVSTIPWTMPCVEITDKPHLAWRGFMLDVSRHFFDKTEVETLLEQMAILKLNVFHWHLTDDNGWRIEIKKYPKLTSVGAWHVITPLEKNNKHIKDGLYGGFYTQDDIREIVAYAGVRHITIVPEIDIPGHCSAAMTAYPELAPNNGWTPVIAIMQKGSGERCGAMGVAKEKSVQFCKDVLEELITLFPSQYIHIGGDEVDYEQWQRCPRSVAALKELGPQKDFADLQIKFTNDMIAFLESKGRHAIIWNNLYRQTIDKRAVNQFWRDMNPAREFANTGYTVLVSDSSHYYFDHHPSLEQAYGNDPMNMHNLSPEGRDRIPGIEGCAWTEHVPTLDVLYQHIYPLLFAYAETGWTPQQSKDWNSFGQRVKVQEARFTQLGIGN